MRQTIVPQGARCDRVMVLGRSRRAVASVAFAHPEVNVMVAVAQVEHLRLHAITRPLAAFRAVPALP